MAAPVANRVLRTGGKQVFLPDHMITFIRPRDNQPPNFATFKVPLTFNKLDLRDYLRHAYGVGTLGVRSQLRQQRPRRSGVHGRVYRPPPVKTMTVELARPFVWPERPADTTPWVSEREKRRDEAIRRQKAWQRTIQKTGHMPLRDEVKADGERLSLRDEARRLLSKGGWSNERPLDPKFEKPRDPEEEKEEEKEEDLDPENEEKQAAKEEKQAAKEEKQAVKEEKQAAKKDLDVD